MSDAARFLAVHGDAFTVRRRFIWVPVVAGACVALAFAVVTLASGLRGPHALLGATILLLLAGGAQLAPFRVGGGPTLYLTAVPLVCAAVLYGAATASVMALAAFLFEHAKVRRPPERALYNMAVWVLMAGAAGIAARVHPAGDLGLICAVVLAAGAEELTNIGLVSLMYGEGRMRETAAAAWEIASGFGVPFALSLSVVPLFAVTWPSHPTLASFAVGPLAVVVLYLRSQEATREAIALALTDPLTGLGNRRSFEECLERELERSDDTGKPVSLCLLDVDGLKGINDTQGHEAGDHALVTVAEVLRKDGEAFRYGGDEFVLLLPGLSHAAAERVAEAVQGRLRTDHAEGPLSVAVGVATFPRIS